MGFRAHGMCPSVRASVFMFVLHLEATVCVNHPTINTLRVHNILIEI